MQSPFADMEEASELAAKLRSDRSREERLRRMSVRLLVVGCLMFVAGLLLLGNSLAPTFLRAARCTSAGGNPLESSCGSPPAPKWSLLYAGMTFSMAGATAIAGAAAVIIGNRIAKRRL